MPWFSCQVNTNSFSAEEEFRSDVLVKCSYFEGRSHDCVRLVWSGLLTLSFDVVQGF